MLDLMKKYLKNEDGATAIEYGLIAAGISIAIAATVFLVGGSIDGLFNQVVAALAG
ncbi:MAG: Flp family type IVb pilin [Alphaproteobacteria bacterium]|nr:Flp family type IVb pilin [Alphaproteobacteria bacterium]